MKPNKWREAIGLIIYGTSELKEKGQAYDLLTLAVQEHWGIHPLPAIAHHSGGKPYFAHMDSHQFNLSHSGAMAVCALDEKPVGVDIQMVKQLRPNLPKRVCAPHELEWLEGQRDLWRSFAQLWAMKESCVKQSGRGLTFSIPTIEIPLPQQGVHQYYQNGLWFSLYGGPDWVGAACGLTAPPEHICWRSLAED